MGVSDSRLVISTDSEPKYIKCIKFYVWVVTTRNKSNFENRRLAVASWLAKDFASCFTRPAVAWWPEGGGRRQGAWPPSDNFLGALKSKGGAKIRNCQCQISYKIFCLVLSVWVKQKKSEEKFHWGRGDSNLRLPTSRSHLYRIVNEQTGAPVEKTRGPKAGVSNAAVCARKL